MEYDHADPAHAGALHHVELCTDDLPTALDFWDWLLTELGYEEKNDWGSGPSWIRAPTYNVLREAEENDHPVDRYAPGLNHIAFHATSREQVDKLTASIREREESRVLDEEQHPYAGATTRSTARTPKE